MPAGSPAPTRSSPATARPLRDLALPADGRGMLVGKTRSGKSTLAEYLIREWLAEHGDAARILVVDSKPRFRAEYRLDGWPARRRYRKWGHGAALPGSYLLDLRHEREYEQVWRQGGRVAIAQGDLRSLPSLRWAVDRFYALSDAKHRNLVYVDELADFYASSGLTALGDPSLKVIRSGGERGVAFLGATQRPKGIPPSAFTEMTALYYFGTPFEQDWDRIREMDLPEDIDRGRIKRNPHSFYFYNHANPERAGYYRLNLDAA